MGCMQEWWTNRPRQPIRLLRSQKSLLGSVNEDNGCTI